MSLFKTQVCIAHFVATAVGFVAWHCTPESCLYHRAYAVLPLEAVHLLYEFSEFGTKDNFFLEYDHTESDTYGPRPAPE